MIVKKINCSLAERQESQEEQHHGVWDISKYLTDFSIFSIHRGGGFVFPLAADLSPSHQAPSLPRVIVWPPEFKAGRSVCADTM